MTDDALRLVPGTVLDQRYRIVSAIKAGGMGAVYRAQDAKLGDKTCAVKEMLDQFETPAERQAGIDRFLREVQVMERMSHANIPRVTDHFLEKNNFYFVMEFIEGTDLSTKLRDEGAPGLPWEDVLAWGVQVCDALQYLHTLRPERIVHRDLKPSNLMLRHADGRILVIDFGIARVTNPGPNLWIGTREYAPPEQQLGRHEPRSDLFALGASLHQLITGRRPDGIHTPTFKDSERAVFPAALCETMTRAVQLWPEDRFQSAREMRDALIEVLGYTPQMAADAAFVFAESVQRLKEIAIDPPLRQVISRYANECQTPHLPAHLERLVFTLGAETPFQLIIQINESGRKVDFFERQGVLDARLLGAVDPSADDAPSQAAAHIEHYVRDYENFKNASWQLML